MNKFVGAVAETCVGWLAVYGSENVVHGLSIGFASDEDAVRWLRSCDIDGLDNTAWQPTIDKLAAYLSGEAYGVEEIRHAEPERLTEFQRTVRQIVAAIPYGESRTYGEVAALAGHPRAARAVGTVMSSNHVPLLMPCHRVVPAGGKLGGFTGPGGVGLKEKLLKLERTTAEKFAGKKPR